MFEKIKDSHCNLFIDLQNPYNYAHLPKDKKLQQWASVAYQQSEDASVTLRFVNREEGLKLNQTYRTKDYATNILSFSFDPPVLPEGVELDQPAHLGDLIMCLSVIEKEAKEQKKSLEQHCVHLIIHGMLHLQGYDHIEEQQAQQMEALERGILKELGFPDPYLIQ